MDEGWVEVKRGVRHSPMGKIHKIVDDTEEENFVHSMTSC